MEEQSLIDVYLMGVAFGVIFGLIIGMAMGFLASGGKATKEAERDLEVKGES